MWQKISPFIAFGGLQPIKSYLVLIPLFLSLSAQAFNNTENPRFLGNNKTRTNASEAGNLSEYRQDQNSKQGTQDLVFDLDFHMRMIGWQGYDYDSNYPQPDAKKIVRVCVGSVSCETPLNSWSDAGQVSPANYLKRMNRLSIISFEKQIYDDSQNSALGGPHDVDALEDAKVRSVAVHAVSANTDYMSGPQCCCQWVFCEN